MSLSTADSTTVQEAIRGRRTCARFRSEPLPEALLGELLEAARWAPSADNSQPWYLIVIRDPSTKRRLNAVAAESRSLYDLWASALPPAAPHTLSPDFTAVPLCLAVFADPRLSPAFVEGEQSHVLAAGMAIENIWLAAHARGIGACLWTHLEQDQLKSILGVPHHYYFAGLLGLGYPAEGDKDTPGVRQRRSLSESVGYEWFKTSPGQPPPAEKLALLAEYLGHQEKLDGN